MKKIFKYPLDFGQKSATDPRPYTASVTLPIGSKALKVDDQLDVVTLWAMVDPDEQRTETREFVLFGTGWPIPDNVQLGDYWTVYQGMFVWHIFEVIRWLNSQT